MGAAVGLLLLTAFSLLSSGTTEGVPSAAPATSEPKADDAAGVSPDRPDGADLTLTDQPLHLPAGQWFPDRRFPSVAVVVRTRTVSLIDLTSGESADFGLPAEVTGPVAMIDDHLVVVSNGRAKAVPISLEGVGGSDAVIDLGPAESLRLSGNRGYVWLGVLDPVVAPTGPETIWEERNLAGDVLRSTRRTSPLEFDRPDLIWGFDSSVFRLTTSGERPWRLIGDGYPVAAGASDVILTQCDHDEESADRNCRRVWFDVLSGDQRDLLHGDAADNIGTHFGGRISPSGRFVTRQIRAGAPVDLWRVGSGELVANDCLEQTEIAWSRDDHYFLCATEEGLVAVDTHSVVQVALPTGTKTTDSSVMGWSFLSNG